MTVSEEKVDIGTRSQEVRRARLRNYVETDTVEQTVPVERVRLGTETVTSEETVSEEVRKERVDSDGDVDDRGSGRRS